MTFRHGGFPLLDQERWRWMAGRRGDEEDQRDEEWLLDWSGPHCGGRVTWLGRSRHDFGWGFQLGRNGGESDIGLDLHAGRWAHTWLRLRAPWLKWLRLPQGKPDWYEARHTGLKIHPYEHCYLSWEIDHTANSWRRSDPWWRRGSLNDRHLWGRTDAGWEDLDVQPAAVLLPEGVYEATAKLRRLTRRHVRWPGTWLDRRRQTVFESWELEVEGGIPVEGKGENSYDCGMDGHFGISGGFQTIDEACTAMAAGVLRDRARYGGPHNLPHPMTVTEASSAV